MKRFISKTSFSICIVLVLAFCSSCTSGRTSENVTVLRLSHVLDSEHPVHKAMAFMGDRLETLSDGQLQLRIYPSGQLGNERESVELLQLGALAMTKVSSAVAANFIPEMSVFSLPYLFEDRAHYWQVFNGEIGKEILLSGVESARLRGLCFYDAGFRSFFTQGHAIREPSDLSGMKIRVMRSALAIRSINLLGGSATPIAWGELYTALQQGIVDGAENNPPNLYSSQLYEQVGYYSLDGHSAPPDVLIISSYVWDRLSAQEQKWLEQAVAESVVLQKKLWKEATETALREVQEAGITVVHPDKEPFRQEVEPIYEDISGTWLGKLAERIRALPSGGTPDSVLASLDRPVE